MTTGKATPDPKLDPQLRAELQQIRARFAEPRSFVGDWTIRIVSLVLPLFGFGIALNQWVRDRNERARLAWKWALAGLLVQVATTLLVIVVVFLVSSSGAAGFDEAKRGVAEFRARVARTAYAEIHRAAAAEFRQAATEAHFLRFMTALDSKLGAWQSAGEPAWNVNKGTAGHFVSLTYQSQFAKGAAREQFAWRIEKTGPVLLGYHVD